MPSFRLTPALLLIALACAAPAETPTFLETDSAGITILESFQPAWNDDPAWTVAADPELSIGAGASGGDDPDNPPWGFIREVGVLSSGSLVVGDITISEVMVFDSLGRRTHRFGGRGEGPGELADFGRALTCGGDTIVAADTRVFNFFDSEGRFIRRLAALDGRTRTPLSVVTVSSDCRSFLVSDDRYRPAVPEGPEGRTYRVLAWTDDSFTKRDTVARVAVAHIHQMDGFNLPVPWTAYGSTTLAAGDDLVHGYPQRPELRVVSPGGELTRILRWHAVPDPVTDEDRRRWDEEQEVGEGGFRLQLSDFPWIPEHKAFFDDLNADDEGNLWARVPPPPDPAPERWTVLGFGGQWLGTVEMPDGFRLGTVARGRVYGIHRDELGIRTVRVHRLERGG